MTWVVATLSPAAHRCELCRGTLTGAATGCVEVETERPAHLRCVLGALSASRPQTSPAQSAAHDLEIAEVLG